MMSITTLNKTFLSHSDLRFTLIQSGKQIVFQHNAARFTTDDILYTLFELIDFDINNFRHFIKIHFGNKWVEFVSLPSTFKDKSVTSSITAYFKIFELPIICFEYNNLIRCFVCLFCGLTFKTTGMFVLRRSINLTTRFPGQA